MRLFVALDVPEESRERLRGVIAQLKPECPHARWVRPEGIHITLKFIGDVAPEKLDAIVGALALVYGDGGSGAMQPVEIRFRGIGFFPNERRPRVLWCGVAASPYLAQIARDIERALEPLGIESESRAYTPHLTLARSQQPQDFERLARASAGDLAQRDLGTARETAFHLFESFLKPTGAEYKRLRTFPFATDAA